MSTTPSITEAVKSKYAAVAESTLSTQHEGVRAVAQAFGYSPDELASIPADANMGLSCGNPTAMASLKHGETVVDLGCGGGLDVFLAAQKVGPTGKAIGIDMTQAMIDRARRNASQCPGLQNMEFYLATIDKLPLPDNSVDVVISNCVINLAPDKAAVFKEIARVLKPGGRVAVSDIALKQPLPPELRESIMAYVGCIAGAISIPDYEAGLKGAGFSSVQVIDSGADLNAYAKVENQSGCCSPAMEDVGMDKKTEERVAKTSCCSLPTAGTGGGGVSACCSSPGAVAKEKPDLHAQLKSLLERHNVNDYAASVKVFAVKS
jgi:SAM-dependent methyltransferase